MFTFDNERHSYDFNGEYDIFRVEGTCMFGEKTLQDVTASVYVPAENPTEEGDVDHIGTFNYNSRMDDRANYNVYISHKFVKKFMEMLPDIVAEIEKSKE